jgi:colanic acid biosynthesis glycosyl transferase WcaI
MHVVLLNQPFYPDVVATAQMGKDLADALVARGHQVTAVSSRSIYGQTGAVLPKRQTVGGVRIVRVGSNVFGKRGVLARVFDFALYYLLAAWKVLWMRPRPDVVVGFSTPPFIAALGILARWTRGSRSVYWVMDLYPDVGVAGGVFRPGALSTRAMERLSRWLLRRSDAVVVLGRCMRERVLAKGVPPDHVHVITVWDASDRAPDPAAVPEPARPAETPGADSFRARWGLGDAFVVMYSGNLGLAHDAETICEAMRRLRDRADIRFVFVGGGKRRAQVEAFIREHGLTNAQYREYVPREELGAMLASADAHLVSVDEQFRGLIVPSKLYSVLAVGRPVIYVGPEESEIALTLRELGAGEGVRTGDAEGLARVIADLAADRARAAELGRRAAAGVAGRFDRASSCARWVALLESLVPAGSTPRSPARATPRPSESSPAAAPAAAMERP